MSFSLIYERPFGDKEMPFVFPETDASGNVVAEPLDNGLSHRITITELTVSQKKKGATKFEVGYWVRGKECDFYVTEARLIFKLQSLKKDLKFTGSVVDYGVEALFKKFEDKKYEGKNHIGHIRYEWLYKIMYFEKYGRNNNMLRFVYFDDEMTSWQVQITFANDMDVRFIANEILHMACKYRARTKSQKDEEMLQFIEKYKNDDIPRAADPTNNFSSISFPTALKACYGKNDRPDP